MDLLSGLAGMFAGRLLVALSSAFRKRSKVNVFRKNHR